jgi:copper chaperone CopZ
LTDSSLIPQSAAAADCAFHPVAALSRDLSPRAIIEIEEEIMPEYTLRVENMHCGSCVRRVSQVLAAEPGVAVKEVRIGAARFEAPESLPVDSAIAALARAGYPARLEV